MYHMFPIHYTASFTKKQYGFRIYVRYFNRHFFVVTSRSTIPSLSNVLNNPTSQKFCCVDVAVGCSPQSNPNTLNNSACLKPSALG